jgi:hypothetical protein
MVSVIGMSSWRSGFKASDVGIAGVAKGMRDIWDGLDRVHVPAFAYGARLRRRGANVASAAWMSCARHVSVTDEFALPSTTDFGADTVPPELFSDDLM